MPTVPSPRVPSGADQPTVTIPGLPRRSRPWRPGRGAGEAGTVVLAVLLALGGLATLALLVVEIVRGGDAGRLAVGVLVGYGVAQALVIRLLDRRRLLHAGATVLALAWGATAAMLIVMVGEGIGRLASTGVFGTRATSLWSAAVLAPVFEEPAKALGVLLVALAVRRGLSGPLHGMLLGSLCGLGFQLVEDAGYVALGHAPWTVLGMRLLTGLGGHWVLSGLGGLAVGLVATAPAGQRVRRRLLALAALLTAMVLHGLYDATGLYLILARLLTPTLGRTAAGAVLVAAVPVVALVVGAVVYRRVLAREPVNVAPTPTGRAAPSPVPLPVPTGGAVPFPTGGPVPMPTGGPAPFPTGGPVPMPTGAPERDPARADWSPWPGTPTTASAPCTSTTRATGSPFPPR